MRQVISSLFSSSNLTHTHLLSYLNHSSSAMFKYCRHNIYHNILPKPKLLLHFIMYLRLSTLAGAILKVVSASSDISLHTTSTHEEVSRELLTSCETYDSGIPSTTITMLWTNALSGDTEWLNKNNYNYKHWPGLSKFNKVIMAVNDVGTVHCDATYMTNDIYLEMRSGATLDVSANLNIDDQLIMKTNSVLTQTSTSTMLVKIYIWPHSIPLLICHI